MCMAVACEAIIYKVSVSMCEGILPWPIGIVLAPLFGNKPLKKIYDSIMERYHDKALLDGDRAAILRFIHRTTTEVYLQCCPSLRNHDNKCVAI